MSWHKKLGTIEDQKGTSLTGSNWEGEFPAVWLMEEEHEKQIWREDVDLLVVWEVRTLPYKAHRWVSEWLQVGKMEPGSPVSHHLRSVLRSSGTLVRTLEDLGIWDMDEAPLAIPSLHLTSATQALSHLHSRELPTTEPSSAWESSSSSPFKNSQLPFALCLVTQLCPTLCDPMDCRLPSCSAHGNSSGRNTGVGCCVLLQGIFLTQ